MFKINDKLFIDLEPFLDLSKIFEYNERISYGIAKNCDEIYPAYASQSCIFNQKLMSHDVASSKIKTKYPELTGRQSETMAKFSGSANLGSFLHLKKATKSFQYKHVSDFSEYTNAAKDFKFLFEWIEEQDCFDEFGRVIFFFNEPWQKGAIHCDYDDSKLNIRKDMFIWIRGPVGKQFFIYDSENNQKHYCPYSATIFNNNNYHGSENNDWYSSWSLRIDGIFKKSWADKVKISDYFHII
jgi:hypothetical protein